MLKSFLVTSFRNLVRNGTYTLINSLGLSVGIAACIIIFLVADFELSFDKFHSKYDSIYRVVTLEKASSGEDHTSTLPYPFGQAFSNDFNDVPLNTHVHMHDETLMTYGAEKMKVEGVLFADSLFFDVFDFGVLSGNPHVELGQPGKVFLTQSFANKLGTALPKTIKLDNKLELEVAGLVADPPKQSHINYVMIVSMPSLSGDFLGLPIDTWGMRMAGFSYIVLPEHVQKEQIETRLEGFKNKYFMKEHADRQTLLLQPLSDIHFSEQYATNLREQPTMSYANLGVLIVLGVFILAVASINFINLSTALAVKKSREIGVRKTLGASRSQLTRQYLMEALLITLISTAIAIVMVEVSVDSIGRYLETSIAFDVLTQPSLVLFLIALIIITALLSGLYPALVLSRFNPAVVLKNKLSYQGSSGAYARKYLVMFQFVVAQLLIIGTVVVANQMDYFHSRKLGFIKDSIVNVTMPERTDEKRSAFRSQLEGIAGIEQTTFSIGAPTSDVQLTTGAYLTEQGPDARMEAGIKCVDTNYMSTYGLELAAGKWFLPSDEKLAEQSVPEENRQYSYIVNEAMVRKLGFASNEEIIGKYITSGLNDINAPVIGVVKDFHTRSLHEEVDPIIMVHFPYFYVEAGIRFNGQTTRETVEAVKKAYANVFPDYLIEFSFLDETINNLYQQEERNFALVRVFAGLSILISCLGLLGLVSFLTQQKTKEVGIRKVFGASVSSIVVLFSRGFVKLVFVSFLCAAPVGWYVMNNWLNEFAYKTTIGVSVFVIAIGSTLLLALLTVSVQSISAAMENPVKALRSE